MQATFTICNKLGLHARASAKLVACINNYDSEVQLEKDGVKVNGKSILGVMMLAAAKGTTITVHASGSDAEQALQAIGELIHDRFGEEE